MGATQTLVALSANFGKPPQPPPEPGAKRGISTVRPGFARARARPYKTASAPRELKTMRLVSTPFNPTPPGAIVHPLRTADGVLLRTARWTPPHGARGTVTILSGRAEFIEKYYETIRNLLDRGLSVAIFDWRGQGGSARQLEESAQRPYRRFRTLRARLRRLRLRGARGLLPEALVRPR